MSSLKEKKRIVNKIMALVLSGFHYHDACEIEQVSFGDFCYWIANTKALRAIKESYELQKQQLLEQSLFRAGLGYEYTETHQTKRVRRNAGGDILGDELIQKEIKKLALPNTQAALLLLLTFQTRTKKKIVKFKKLGDYYGKNKKSYLLGM